MTNYINLHIALVKSSWHFIFQQLIFRCDYLLSVYDSSRHSKFDSCTFIVITLISTIHISWCCWFLHSFPNHFLYTRQTFFDIVPWKDKITGVDTEVSNDYNLEHCDFEDYNYYYVTYCNFYILYMYLGYEPDFCNVLNKCILLSRYKTALELAQSC